MKCGFALLFIFIVVQFAYTQTISIKDGETGNSIESVTIFNEEKKIYSITNAKGQADISAFKNLENIEIIRVGYKTQLLSYSEIEKYNFVVLLAPTYFQINELLVSANKWNQKSQNLISKITIISAKDVAFCNPQTAADMLGSSGEVFIQKSQQGGGSPMIRGFSANRLLYIVDGVRMNTAIFRAGNIQNVISLDPLLIENTEVFFGPGSVVYGSDAIGGVMSFYTIKPQFSLTDKLLVFGKTVSRYSSANNEITNHFDVGIGSRKWASVTSITYSKFGDVKMGTNGPDEYLKHFYVQQKDNIDRVVENSNPLIQNPSGYSQVNVMQKIRFTPNKNWDIQYGFHYSATTDYSRYDRLIETQTNGFPIYAVWKYGPQKWMMNNLSLSYSKSAKIFDNVLLCMAQQDFEESRIDRKFNAFRLRNNTEKVKAYSINLDFEKSISKHRLFYGAEFVQNNVTSTGAGIDIRDNSVILIPDRYPISTWRSYAAYLNYQFEISKRIIIQAGARYNGFDISSDFSRNIYFFPFSFTHVRIQNNASTGSIGCLMKPAKNWKFSLNGSSGFRAPNVDDIGKIFDISDREIVVPNVALKAEYAYNVDVNISALLKDIVKLDATGFYTYLSNAMVRREYKVDGKDSILYDGILSKVYAIQNAANANVYGFNLGLEIKLLAGFVFTTRYNYQVGKEEMDNGIISPSRHAAPAFGISQLTYSKNKFYLQLYAFYSAEVSYLNLNAEEKQKSIIYAKDKNGNPYSPSWYTLNFKAMVQLNKSFLISTGIENITNVRYRPYSSGLVAPGRNFIVSFKLNF